MFRFHSFYKILNMRYTESDIISHLQDKTRVEYGEEQQLGTGSASLGKNMEKVIVSELIVN